MDGNTLLVLLIASAVATGTYALVTMFMSSRDAKLRDRLKGADDHEPKRTGAGEAVIPLLQRIGTAAAEPFMPKKAENRSSLRKQLATAGIYSHSAVALVTGAKVILLLLGLILGYVAGVMLDMLMLGLSFGGLLGYVTPRIWLNMRIKANQRALNHGLPDALDLMVVCVEAGLTVDAAIQRVGQELGLAHPALSRELGITHMETRVGLSRAEALKNLGARTGNAALQSLGTMLVQAERFGTSVGSALRIQADSLRTKRQHAAEEMASKASVKMSFPLVLFIFPATFIVLAGPTVIGLLNSALFAD